MKKLLKSKICGSVNSAHRALFTGKVKYFDSKKKKKKKETQNVRLGSANLNHVEVGTFGVNFSSLS